MIKSKPSPDPEVIGKEKPRVEYDQIVSSFIMHPAEWNVNKCDRKTQKDIAESIQEYGLLEQLVIEPHPAITGEYRILGGNHRWLEIQGDIRCNIIYGLTEAQAKKLSLSLNIHGKPDPELLVGMLSEFYEAEGAEMAAIGIPYTPEEIENLINNPPPLPPQEEETWKKLVLDVPDGIYQILMQAVEKTGIQDGKLPKRIVKALELVCVHYIYDDNAPTIETP